MKVELRERADGSWFARVVHGRRAFAQIRPSRELALRQVMRGIRFCLKP